MECERVCNKSVQAKGKMLRIESFYTVQNAKILICVILMSLARTTGQNCVLISLVVTANVNICQYSRAPGGPHHWGLFMAGN